MSSEASPAAPGRVLGLDPGEARIGVAISDPDRRVAVPLGTVRVGPPDDLRAIASLVSANDVVLIVVGLPLRLSGERGAAALSAEAFAEALRAVVSVPVEMHDERLSTAQAERGLAAAGARGRRRRAVVDRAAATVILQAYLDNRA